MHLTRYSGLCQTKVQIYSMTVDMTLTTNSRHDSNNQQQTTNNKQWTYFSIENILNTSDFQDVLLDLRFQSLLLIDGILQLLVHFLDKYNVQRTFNSTCGQIQSTQNISFNLCVWPEDRTTPKFTISQISPWNAYNVKGISVHISDFSVIYILIVSIIFPTAEPWSLSFQWTFTII